MIGIFDAEQIRTRARHDGIRAVDHSGDLDELQDEIRAGLERLRMENPRAVVVQPVLFDFIADSQSATLPEVLTVPPLEKSRSTTMKTVMCDVSARFLSELAVYSRKIQASEWISSPGLSSVLPVSHPLSRLSFAANDASDASLAYSKPDSERGSGSGRPSIASPRTSDSTIRPTTQGIAASQEQIDRSCSPAPSESALRDTGSIKALESKNTTGPKPSNRASTVPTLSRDSSRGRRSKQANALSVAERARNRLASRQGLILGSLYLLAGRWPDALKELVIHTARAKLYMDHIWYAKGLENILVTLLLLAWARLDFTVPAVCFPAFDRKSAVKQIPPSNLVRSSQSFDSQPDGSARTVTNLSMAIPELVHMIIDSYLQARDSPEDAMPQYPFSECIIRLTYLLAVYYRAESALNSRNLSHLVQGTKWSRKGAIKVHSRKPAPAAREISTLLFEALPSELFSSSAPLADAITILSGMISVLSFAGLYRKRAMLIRETLSVLIPRLIQARKVGAAELGIHPAASLAARHGLNIDSSAGAPLVSQGQVEQGFHNLLSLLCNTYGVSFSNGSGSTTRNDSPHENGVSDNSIEARVCGYIAQDWGKRQFGGFGLKSDVLRLCANFSEALPNFPDVVHFTAALIKTAGPGTAPRSARLHHQALLPREEQIRFVNKIYRTQGVFKTADADQLETEYWDPFLVRGVELSPSPEDYSLTPHSTAELASKETEGKEAQVVSGGFLYNPTQVTAKQKEPLKTIAADEPIAFILVLQNLYDFDVLIERCQMMTEGVAFHATAESIILGPCRQQSITLHGTAERAGTLTIIGCRIKVQGCREEEFPIFAQPWNPQPPVKAKKIGLEALGLHDARPLSAIDVPKSRMQDPDEISMPATQRDALTVTNAQPHIAILSTSLSQSRLMLLEGETQSFSVVIGNVSDTVPIDFLRLSFTHSVVEPSKASLKAIQNGTHNQQCMRWINTHVERETLGPGSSIVLHVEAHGILGLAASKLTIDYGCVDGSAGPSFFTKRISISMHVSVDPMVLVECLSVLPERSSNTQQQRLGEPLGTEKGSKQIILAFNLKNMWSSPISASVWDGSDHENLRSTISMQPNESGQLLLPLRLTNFAGAMKTGIDDDGKSDRTNAERSQREKEQIKQLLLAQLQTKWQDIASEKEGTIDLSHVQIRESLVAALLPDAVDISLTLVDTRGDPVEAVSDPAFLVTPHASFILKVTLKNCTSRAIRPLIRFQPLVRGSLETDIGKFLSWSGPLQRKEETIKPDQSVDGQLGLCPIAEGIIDIEVLASEFHLLPHQRASQALPQKADPHVELSPTSADPHQDGLPDPTTPTPVGSTPMLGYIKCTLVCRQGIVR